MYCPQCQHEMREIEYEGANVHTCDGCGGEFLGASELGHIVNRREERFSDTEAPPRKERPRFGVPEAEMKRILACPSCDAQMIVGNYGGDSGIYIDRCDRCGGVWLDCEELEHIQILMEKWADDAPHQLQSIAGELELARRRAAERTSHTFAGSRFAFVNALINRFLDAA